MIQWMLAIWYLIPLPFLKPAWTSGSSQFMYWWNLSWRILSITLLVCEMSANCVVVWVFFGIAFLRDWNENRPYETSRQSSSTILEAWGWCTGTTQRDGMEREEGGGFRWGTHVYLWWIYFDIWQNQYNSVKFKTKIKLKKKSWVQKNWCFSTVVLEKTPESPLDCKEI